MKKYVLLALVGLASFQLNARAQDITVAAAANLQYTLEDLKVEFTRETGIQVKSVIGASGKLTSQIENGAPFDVFLSADMKYPRRLYTEGFSLRSPKVYADGILVLWSAKSINLSQGVTGLTGTQFQKIAIANPQTAPYGEQAVNALKYYKIDAAVKAKLVYGESIAQTNQFITTGAADAGFTAKSVVVNPHQPAQGQWVAVDAHAYQPIDQGVIVLKYGDDHEAQGAHRFYDFLFSPAAKEIFKKYGYQLPS